MFLEKKEVESTPKPERRFARQVTLTGLLSSAFPGADFFLQTRCHSCHPTVSKTLPKGSQSTDAIMTELIFS